MCDVLTKIYEAGIVPVIAIDKAENAVPLANALVRGGIPVAEVTFRTEAAEEAIAKISSEVPDMTVGAGTVLTEEQADRAIESGAQFIVSPGYNPAVVRHVLGRGVTMIPGTATPGEMEQAMSMGLSTVKFFPAEQNGGPAMIKALSGPYRNLKFMPTGGINEKNLLDYLKLDQVIACGGSWMVRPQLIEKQDWDEIERLAKSAVKTMFGFQIEHVGINTENSEEAAKLARTFAVMFGMEIEDAPTSIFMGNHDIEIMKMPFLGTMGHICISCYNAPRAMAYFKRRGYTFREETVTPEGGGYFTDEIGGFAVHIKPKRY